MLTLILKANNSCNLRCSYCCVGDKSSSSMLNAEEMSRALSWFASEARMRGERSPSVIFHGGEPLLIPVSQYRECLDTLLKDNADLDFTFQIQTNGTIINDEIIAFLKDYDVQPGISVDGSQVVHDSQRIKADGSPSYSLVMKNIRRLKSEGLNACGLMVLTRKSLNAGLEWLNDFAEMRVPMKINPLYSAGEALKHDELSLRPGDYADYLIRGYEYILDNEINISLTPIEYILQGIINDITPRGCVFSGACHDSFLCIDCEGDIYPCGRFADSKSNIIGNIHTGITSGGRQILASLKVLRISQLRGECKDCRHVRFCNGGCSVMNGAMCKDFTRFTDYLFSRGITKYKEYLLHRRAEICSMICSS